MSAHHNKKKIHAKKIICLYIHRGGFYFVGEVEYFAFVGIGQLDEPVKIKGHTFFVIV
jgi:hypothetical protein